ncbi:substrate-binding domain-containing protein [Bacillus sp. JCM 19041]|uniref:substrate-binding domain-containing protein n=1 Tax=Bacillus sp. JCM 19041 TaxID=1460637 RepID=UPI0018D0B3BC
MLERIAMQRKLFLFGDIGKDFTTTSGPFIHAAGGKEARIAVLGLGGEGWDAYYERVFVKRWQGVKSIVSILPNNNELVEKGHKKIVYVGIYNGIGRRQQAKQAGYEYAMKERGLDPKIVDTVGLNAGDADGAVTQFLAGGGLPDAIICSSYDLTMGTLRVLKSHQLNVPNDVSVISYDNIPQLAEKEVSVTSVGVPIDILACALVEMLIDLIEKGEGNVRNRKLTPILVQRKSVKIRK